LPSTRKISFCAAAFVSSGPRGLAAFTGRLSANGRSSWAACLSPAVTVASQSGNTTLTFARVPARVQVSADSGNVTLVLPPGAAAYRVAARSSDGSTAVRVRRNPTSPHVITVTDQSGNMTITH
jgi:Putative adhesin